MVRMLNILILLSALGWWKRRSLALFWLLRTIKLFWLNGDEIPYVLSKYALCVNGRDTTYPISATSCAPWKATTICYPSFTPFTHLVVGSDSRIRFDYTLGCILFPFPLFFIFLRLFNLRVNCNGTLSEFIVRHSSFIDYSFHFRCNIRDSEVDDLLELLKCLENSFVLFNSSDHIVCSLSNSTIFSVTVRSFCVVSLLPVPSFSI